MINAKTYIITLNFFGKEDTSCLINSLLKLKEDIVIVVVDNSDNEEEWSQLKDAIEKKNQSVLAFCENHQYVYNNEPIVLIKSTSNRGFSAGNNIGIKFAKEQNNCKYIWLLNNDTEVLGDSLTALIDEFNNDEKIILGSKLVYYHNRSKIQAVGGSFNKMLFIPSHIGEGQPVDTPKTSFPKIDYPVGASMFFGEKFFDEVGFLSEDFFLYYEELDLVYRAKQKGYKIDWCEKSVVYHKEGASIGSSYNGNKTLFSEIHLFKSRKIFIAKYYGLGFRFYFSSILLLINRLRKGKFKLVKEITKITFG